jgi:hypothetical protein
MAKHTIWASILVSSVLLLGACGGGTPPADSPDESPADSGDPVADATDDASVGDVAEDAPADAPADGIIRDADGDGKPDGDGGGCEAKNETQCKINSACAWNDAGKCVEAKG